MQALIPLSQGESGEQLVDARQLHEFLGVGKDFSNWIKKRIVDGGFIDAIDFTPVLAKSTGGRPAIDYGLSLRMAQHLCMMERTSKGEQARDYFIECERLAKGNVPKLGTRMELIQQLKLAADIAFEAEKENLRLSAEKQRVESELVDAKHATQVLEHTYGIPGYMDLGTAAKILHHGVIGPKSIFKLLVKEGLIFKNPDRENKPYDYMQRYQRFFKMRPIPADKSRPYFADRGITYHKITINFEGFIFVAKKVIEKYGTWDGLQSEAEFRREFYSILEEGK